MKAVSTQSVRWHGLFSVCGTWMLPKTAMVAGGHLAPADGASTCASCRVRLVVSVVQGGNGVAGIEALGSSAPSYPPLRTVMRLSTE